MKIITKNIQIHNADLFIELISDLYSPASIREELINILSKYSQLTIESRADQGSVNREWINGVVSELQLLKDLIDAFKNLEVAPSDEPK